MTDRNRWIARFAPFTLVVLAFIWVFPASATVDRQEAGNFVESLIQDAAGNLTDPSLSLQEQTGKLRELIQRGFDMERVGQLVLGRYWRGATPEQRAEFVDALEDYVVAVYAREFDQVKGVDAEVTGTSEREGRVLVHSRLKRPDGPVVPVVWQVEDVGDRLVITDLIFEGISLVVTKRSEFGSFIRQRGGDLDALTTGLRGLRGG